MSDLNFQDLSTVQSMLQPKPATIASAATVAPSTFLSFISGTTAIATVTPPATGAHVLCFIFTTTTPVAFTTTGNMKAVTTPTTGAPLLLIWNPLESKYYVKQDNMQATIDISRSLQTPGWMSEGELLWLAARAQEYDTIVEFGSFHGRSTRALADNISELGTIWAVDPWNGEYPTLNGDVIKHVSTYVYPNFCENLKDHIACNRVVPVRGYSYSFKLPFKVDMVFIDGDHRYEIVLKDIDKALDLLRDGGLICGHDWDWPTVKQAVTEKLGEVESMENIWFKKKS